MSPHDPPPEPVSLDPAIPPLLRHVPPTADDDGLIDAFTDYTLDSGVEMYPAQEEALLELASGNNVILSTPTGSGKSLVGEAAHLIALARGERSVYTAPIKALVSEKFFNLCAVFGADQVGMVTGDGSVNPDVPIICCTAEILANWALREGVGTPVGVVVADEFHFYADPQRGWAWQVPVLELGRAQFLLMSATLGPTRFFEDELTRTDGARHRARHVGCSVRCRSTFEYRTTTLHNSVQELLATGKAPIYIVHFTQRDADRSGAGLPQPRPAHQGREAAGQGPDRWVPVRLPVRPGVPAVPDGRGRRAPRRAAPQVPTARRAAGPGGVAEDHLRHRHARCRCQRTDPIGAVHPAVQVRRQRRADPQRARVPADRRAGRAARVRRRGATCGCRRRRTSSTTSGRWRRQRSTRRSARSW